MKVCTALQLQAVPHNAYALPCCVCFQDLKCVLKKAGLEGRDIVFLFNDTQIIHEGFLEDLNNILNAGKLRQWRACRTIWWRVSHRPLFSTAHVAQILCQWLI